MSTPVARGLVVEVAADPVAGLRHPVSIELAPGCTTLVGPNAAGKGPVLAALAVRLAAGPGPNGTTGDAGLVLTVPALCAPSELLAQAAPPADGGLGEGGATARHEGQVREYLEAVSLAVLAEARLVVPEVVRIVADLDAPAALDRFDVALSAASGLRACWALGIARAVASTGRHLAAVVIEEPGAFLHPAAQETLRGRLGVFAQDLGVPVVLSAESPFTVPRGATDAVVSLARDAAGTTVVVARVPGDDPQASLLGGLFRDPGLGAVLDRAARLVPGTRAVLVFEGGTDEAYLRLAADLLGRAGDLEGLAIVPAGGASAAAVQAVVLRAETDLPVLVVLDNDDPGRHARDTLVKRMGFDRRREVTTYAEVLPAYPMGTEAEDLFDWRLVDRFVDEMGEEAIRGKQILYDDAWHYDLTTSAKSAFVAWARANATPGDLAKWGLLLDVLQERLGTPGAPRGGDADRGDSPDDASSDA